MSKENSHNRGFRHRSGPGPMGMSLGQKPKNLKGTIKQLLVYMSKYTLPLILVAIFAIGGTIFGIVGPKISGRATTELFNGLMSKLQGSGGINFEKIGNILFGLLGLYLISSALSLVQGMIMTKITQRLTYQFRKEISEKIHRMPMGFFDKQLHGEVLSVITNDVDTLSMGLNQSAIQLITSLTTIIGIIYMMLSINWIMTIIALLMLPLSSFIIALIVKKSQKHFRAQQEYLGHVNGQVEESYSGINIVQAFNNEKNTIAKFEEANNTLYQSAWKSQFLSGLMHPVMIMVGNIGYVIIAILGGFFAANGRITVGNIQAFIQYTRSFTQPIAQIAQISNMLQSMAAAAERIFEFLSQDEEEQTAKEPAVSEDNMPVTASDIIGSVEFKNVLFGYSSDKMIINNFSAKIEPGQKIAIVGPTGAGKTTIVKLLMRFYDINDGAILVDGYDIRSFNRSELRKIFGMVLQDTWLFGGTIMENIRYGKLGATDEEIIEAAKAAHVHHFVQTLPEGYDMILNEETSNVSQGQKQLLTIARAILSDPKILILDEATSSVDTRTELLIQRAMDNLMRGRTSFVIAHRLSTIRDADLILVMDNGDIIEQGKHDELLAKGGFYYDMYYSQFEAAHAI